jgi:hypothetical protein
MELRPGLVEFEFDGLPLVRGRLTLQKFLKVSDALTQPLAAVDHTRHAIQPTCRTTSVSAAFVPGRSG